MCLIVTSANYFNVVCLKACGIGVVKWNDFNVKFLRRLNRFISDIARYVNNRTKHKYDACKLS